MGRPKKVVSPNDSIIQTTSSQTPKTLYCSCCGKEFDLDVLNFYKTKITAYKGIGYYPFCKTCLDKIYQGYYKQYTIEGNLNPDRKAIERICMMLNIYYSDEVFDGAVKNQEKGFSNGATNLISLYIKQVNMHQYCKKNYDTTIKEKMLSANALAKENINNSIAIACTANDIDIQNKIEKAQKFFGTGFSSDDYIFLQDQYEDWTTRHECQTKSQEEMFKNICYTQLNIRKAKQSGLDTKDLDATFLKQLEAAKLQPKQNKGDTTSETQTFGTLIEKWETTRPIPEIDEELRDVDKIGLYLNVFFQGHLAKMMGLKNGLSRLYDKYMQKYTVTKPEYDDDEDGEALFDAIFGSAMNEE